MPPKFVSAPLTVRHCRPSLLMCRKLAADFLCHPVKVTIGSADLAASHSVTQARRGYCRHARAGGVFGLPGNGRLETFMGPTTSQYHHSSMQYHHSTMLVLSVTRWWR